MNKPRGGRGKLSEYGSEMIRIPTPIKDRVAIIKEMFYEDQLDSHDEALANNERLAKEYLNLISSLDTTDKKLISTLEDALAIAKNLLAENTKKRRTTKEVIAKLISGLFDADVKSTDL